MLDGDANGAVVVWHERRRSTGTIQARRIASDGSLGPIRNLSAPGQVYSPQVAVGAGTATAVWKVGDHLVQAQHIRCR